MIRYKHLLSSVSLLGLLACSAFPVSAEELTVSVEGGVAIAQPKTFGYGVEGDTAKTTTSNLGVGFSGAFMLKKTFEMFDLAVKGSATYVPNATTSNTYIPPTFTPNFFGAGSGGTSTVTSTIDFESLDIEIGKTLDAQQDLEVRLFGGLRMLRFHDVTSATLVDNGSGVPSTPVTQTQTNLALDTQFFGLGPKVGLEFAKQMPDSAFGFSGMISGAAAVGQNSSTRTTTTVFTSGAGAAPTPASFNPGASSTSTEVVVALDAALGVDYFMTADAKVTLGYKGQLLTNVGHDSTIFGANSGSFFAHGPFVKLTAKMH